MHRLHAVIWICAMFVNASASYAIPRIDVGDHVLEYNKSGQVVELYVHGGDPVAVLNLNAQIGTSVNTPGHPRITNADVIDDTIFTGNNLGHINNEFHPQLAIVSTMTASGTVPAEGKLGKLVVDTTSVAPGTYALSLSTTINGSSDFGQITPYIIDGRLIVIPEPSAAAIILLACTCLTMRRSQRQRS